MKYKIQIQLLIPRMYFKYKYKLKVFKYTLNFDFNFKTILRVNVIMLKTIGVDFLLLLDDIPKLYIMLQWFTTQLQRKSKFFITFPFQEVERNESSFTD